MDDGKIAVHVAPMCLRESSAPASLHLPLCLLTKLCSQLEQLGSFRNWLGQLAHGSPIRNLGLRQALPKLSPFDGKLDERHCLGSLWPNGYNPPTISNSRPPLKAWRNLTGNCE
jgi:hypothetical protein